MRLFVFLFLVLSFPSTSWTANCDSVSKGYLPLSELTGLYKTHSGGLYPSGSNTPPPEHDLRGRALATQFQPLDTNGQVDPNGVWVLISIGMSNTTQEFSTFISSLLGDTTLNPKLRIVDCAQGGQTASKIKFDTATFWAVAESRLRSRGFTPKQVKAIWLKEANAGPTAAFPAHAIQLRDDLRDVIRTAYQKYPNAKQTFLSSRIYAGYASTSLNPEPYAYESAFSCRWVIEAQLAGNDSLNHLPDSGSVVAPWLAWGPYLWADGLIPRANDSLVWACVDFAADGTHPATSGRAKVAAQLEDFFKTSPYTAPWFLKNYISGCCFGSVGNVDCDAAEGMDISDLTSLIDHLFINLMPLCCPEEANIDLSGNVDIADLTELITLLFISGSPGPSCP